MQQRGGHHNYINQRINFGVIRNEGVGYRWDRGGIWDKGGIEKKIRWDRGGIWDKGGIEKEIIISN